MIMLQHKWDRAESLRECSITPPSKHMTLTIFSVYHVSKATKATKATMKQKSINDFLNHFDLDFQSIVSESGFLWNFLLIRFTDIITLQYILS